MVGGPCDNPGRVAERKLQRMTPTIFNRREQHDYM